jgi:Phosphotransferase system mannitol/fructose-specific IIA domain (Ntr-type)
MTNYAKKAALLLSRRRRRMKHFMNLLISLKAVHNLKKLNQKNIFRFERTGKLGSTGLGGGIAIPHAKIEGLDDFVLALAISQKGVQFEAADNRKVHIFFVLLGPSNSPNEHLKMLSAISRTLRDEDIKNELLAAHSSESIYETIAMSSGEEARKELPQEKKKLPYDRLIRAKISGRYHGTLSGTWGEGLDRY